MPLNLPRKGQPNTEPPDMVRVQLKENDVRSYRRRDAEEILKQTPGAFILGEQETDEGGLKGVGKNLAEAAADLKAKATAANKGRQGAQTKSE